MCDHASREVCASRAPAASVDLTNMTTDSESRDRLIEQILSGETQLSAQELESLSPEQRDALQRLAGLLGTPRPAPEPRPETRVKFEELIQAGFRTFGLLGSGVHASVYDAEDLTLGRRVALKVVYSGWNDETAQRTFLREARTLARIQHPNVVSVWSAAASEGRLLIALEFIEGRNLRQTLAARGALEPNEAARIGRDIAGALAAVHAAGILHRDVNPNNVMLESSGRAVLLDFSVARLKGAEVLRRGGTLGSPVFEAPEVLAGEAPTERSDVYALGILLLWMCSGASPFEGETWEDLRRAAIDGRRRPTADVAPTMPAPLRRIVERALARDPVERYESANSLKAELETFLVGPRLRRWGLAAFALVSALAAYAWTRDPLPPAPESVVDVRDYAQEALIEAFGSHQIEKLRTRSQSMQTLRAWRILGAPVGLEDLGREYADPLEGLEEFKGARLRVPEDHATIGAALEAASSGDVVLVGPGVYRENLKLGYRSIAVVGVGGAARTVIDGSGERMPTVWCGKQDAPPRETPLRVVVRGLGITGGLGLNVPSSYPGGDWYGGGVFIFGGAIDVTLEDCAMWDNGREGTTFGGGLLLSGGNNRMLVRRCLFVGNGAWACGGGAMLDGGLGRFEHCTFVDNYSGNFLGQQGGIGVANGADLEVVDSILWGNSGEQVGGFRSFSETVTVTVARCIIERGAVERGIRALSPAFRDATGSDWRLSIESPARAAVLGPEFAETVGDLGAFRWVDPAPVARSEEGSARLVLSLPRGLEELGSPAAVAEDSTSPQALVRVPEDQPTIQRALDIAPVGARLAVKAGLYREALRVRRPVTIVGELGAAGTVIDARGLGAAVLDVQFPVSGEPQRARVDVRGVTLTGGVGRLLADKNTSFGGAVAISGPVDVELEGCALWRNGQITHTGRGGAMYVAPGSLARLSRCLLAGNEAELTGGIAYVDGGQLDMRDCTLVANRCVPRIGLPCGIALGNGARVEVEGALVWDNLGQPFAVLPQAGETALTVRRSNVQGGWEGSGVIDVPPTFRDPLDSDWRLTPDSAPELKGLGALRP